MRKKIATTVRCVPRYGYDGTEVRTVDLDVVQGADDDELRDALAQWFAQRGIRDAVYDIDAADDGFFAIINDESFVDEWGTPLL